MTDKEIIRCSKCGAYAIAGQKCTTCQYLDTGKGIKRREELVIHNFYKKRIPVCGVLGGGYNKDFDQLVYLHSILHRTCHNLLHYEN